MKKKVVLLALFCLMVLGLCIGCGQKASEEEAGNVEIELEGDLDSLKGLVKEQVAKAETEFDSLDEDSKEELKELEQETKDALSALEEMAKNLDSEAKNEILTLLQEAHDSLDKLFNE